MSLFIKGNGNETPTQYSLNVPTRIIFPPTWTPTPTPFIKPIENQRITEAQKINSTNTAVSMDEKTYEQQIRDISVQNNATTDDIMNLLSLMNTDPTISSQPEFQEGVEK